jgi:hypothetical protein
LGWNIKSSPDASRVDRGTVLFSVAGQSTTITTALQGGACGITSARLPSVIPDLKKCLSDVGIVVPGSSSGQTMEG